MDNAEPPLKRRKQTRETSIRGKVRGASLPTEYELVRFVQDVENTQESWNTHTPACEWKYVKCNDAGEVTALSWDYMYIKGSLHWAYLPQSLMLLDLSVNLLLGKVETHFMPNNLDDINLEENFFEGGLDLQHLPQQLKELCVRSNELVGNISFAFLPANIEVLILSHNSFTGNVDLCDLPSTLLFLHLHRNLFTGTPELRFLPQNLIELNLERNKFTGVVDFTTLPKTLMLLRLDNVLQLSCPIENVELPPDLGIHFLNGPNPCKV